MAELNLEDLGIFLRVLAVGVLEGFDLAVRATVSLGDARRRA